MCIWLKQNLGRRHLIVILSLLLLCEHNVSRHTTIIFFHSILHNDLTGPKDPSFVCFTQDSNITKYSITINDMDIKLVFGNVVGYYFYGNIATSILAGYLGDRYEAKILVFVSVVASAAAGLLTAAAWKVLENLKVLIFTAVFYGMSHGLRVPAVISLLSHWLPKNEKTFLAPLVFCGYAVASIINSVLTEYLKDVSHLILLPYYIYSGAAGVLALVWWIYGASDPFRCRGITEDELKYLDVRLTHKVNIVRTSIPIGSILLSLHVWAFVCAYAANISLWNFQTVFILQYMKKVFNVDVEDHDEWGTIPYIVMIVSTFLLAFFSQRALNKRHFNENAMRRHCSNVGSMGPPIFMLAASFAECHMTLALGCLLIASTLCGVNFCGLYLIPMDLSPNYAGFIMGIGHTLGSLMTCLTLYSMTKFVPNEAFLEYRNVLWLILLMCASGTVLFVIFGSTEIQQWNFPSMKDEKKPTEVPV